MPKHDHIIQGDHLSAVALLTLASAQVTHPHLNECAFCREQYDALLEIETHAVSDSSYGPGYDDAPYRLAAQSETDTYVELLPRHTWYLDGGNVLLRVFEEQTHERLVAWVICDPQRLPQLRFRFSGIDADFHAEEDGSFIIGSSDTDIEPMTVTFVESGKPREC
jgi:hypothetical protein